MPGNLQRTGNPLTSGGPDVKASVLDSLPSAVVAANVEGIITCWNAAAERLYGLPANEVLGRNLLDLLEDPADRNRISDLLDAMRERETLTQTLTVRRNDGSSVPIQLSLSQMRDENDQVVGVASVATDDSERRIAEQRLSLQYAVSSLLADATDFESVAEDVLKAICGHLQWEWCALWVVDDATQRMNCVAVWDDGDERFAELSRGAFETTFHRDLGFLGEVWRSAKPAWLDDIGTTTDFFRKRDATRVGLQSAMAVPIRLAENTVYGVIEFLSITKQTPSAEMTDMVTGATRQVGLFLERQRVIEKLRETTEHLGQLDDSNLVGILRTRLDGDIISANEAFTNMLGYDEADVEAGLRWDEITPPEWHHVNDLIIEDLLATGRSLQKEKEYIHKDGSRVPVILGSAQLHAGSRDVITFVIDMTARKQAEREREESLLREQAARMTANDALLKVEQLLQVTASFSRARTPEEIVRITLDEAISVLGADAGASSLLDTGRNGLDIVDHRGYDPETMQRWETDAIPLDSGYPIAESVVRGEAIWIESRQDLLERFPALGGLGQLLSQSVVALPVHASGEPVGAILLSFTEEQTFTQSQRAFADTLVRFCGQAFERAWLFATEQETRKSASVAQERVQQLLDLTAALSRALTPYEVAHVTIDQGLDALGVDGGMVGLLQDDGVSIRIIHSRGFPEAVVERWQEPIPVARPVPLAEAVLRGEPVWIESRDELFQRYPFMAQQHPYVSETHASLPLIVGNHTYGVLGLSYNTPGQLDAAGKTYAQTVARLCSQAFERAMLYSRERDARVAAEASQQQLALLARAGELLTGGLDTTNTLRLIAQLIVPAVADWCTIDLVDENGMPDRLSVMHTDPEKVRWAEELQSRYPYNPEATSGMANVLRTGRPEFYPVITDEMIAAAAQDEEQLQIMRSVGFSSVMIVPMMARGRTVGALTLVYAESERQYTESDLTVVSNLAYRAALAVDNARLYAEAQQHATRMNIIAEASRSFAVASLDQNAILEILSRQVSRSSGDWTVIRLTSDDGHWLNPAAIFHPNEEAESTLREMYQLDPLRVGEGLTGQVGQTGEAMIVSELDPALIRNRIKPEYRHWQERYPVYSMLIVPMRRRTEVLGTIALFRGERGRPFTEDDRQLVQEIADRAALAVENARLFHQAQDAIRVREEFLSIASHEMRTPLTTITGFAHLLDRQVTRGQIDPDKIATVTGRLLSEARRLDGLVADLLDVTRIQQGRLEIRPEPTDLGEVVKEVATRLGDAQERGTERDIVVNVIQPTLGNWDPARIDQIVTNLLSNALKYSTEGPITLTVDLRDSAAVLAVSDQGIGMSPEDQEQLFQPFSRGHMAHYSSSGTGLGLYITRRIVEMHGGEITVDSKPDAGSTFTVVLPLEPDYDIE